MVSCEQWAWRIAFAIASWPIRSRVSETRKGMFCKFPELAVLILTEEFVETMRRAHSSSADNNPTDSRCSGRNAEILRFLASHPNVDPGLAEFAQADDEVTAA